MISASPEQLNNLNVNVDAFMELSKIGFSSIERLAKLNLDATRAALENGAASSTSMLDAKDKKAPPSLQSLMPGTGAQNAVDYFKNVQEIAADTQKEVTRLMTSYLSSQGNIAGASAGWTKGFEMFKGFGKQITDMTEANSKAVGDVTARLAASAASQAKKVS